MTGPEAATLADFRREYREADKNLREAVEAQGEAIAAQGDAIAALRTDVQPAIDFYLSADRFITSLGVAARETGRFIKWGAGLGASVATIFAATKAMGLW